MRRSDRRHVRLNDYSRSRKTLDQIILFYISDLHFCVKKKKKKIASNRRVATGKFSPLSYLEFYRRRSRLISRITKLQKRRRNFLEDSIDRAPLSRGPIAYPRDFTLVSVKRSNETWKLYRLLSRDNGSFSLFPNTISTKSNCFALKIKESTISVVPRNNIPNFLFPLFHIFISWMMSHVISRNNRFS